MGLSSHVEVMVGVNFLECCRINGTSFHLMDAASTEIISPVRSILNILSVLVFALFSDDIIGHRCGQRIF